MCNLVVFLAFAITASVAASTEPSGYKVEENIEFKQQPVSLHLDAHIPPGKGPFPAVILVHGGGWTAGSKTANFVVPLFEPLTKTGIPGSPSITAWRRNIRIRRPWKTWKA